MKTLSVVLLVCAVFLFITCKKIQLAGEENPGILTAKVLAATCTDQSSSTEVAVQLNDPNSFSSDYKKPGTDSIFHNVVFTFDSRLRNSIGKNFTYSIVRKPNSSDTTSMSTIAICYIYPLVVFEGVNIN